MAAAVEFEQVQGLVRFGYRTLTQCTFLLIKVHDAPAARRWLAGATVSNAVARTTAPSTALQIAFTPGGLLSLGLGPDLLAQFSLEFQAGLAGSPARSRLLGDVGESAPAYWSWGGQASSIDLLVMAYAQPGGLASLLAEIQTPDWFAAFEVTKELGTADLGGVEPFGFPDGLSQPSLDWDRKRVPPATQDEYINQIALGEFLLGYPNEYGRYTSRPLLQSDAAGADCLPAAEEQPGLRDLGRNGCYLVLRTLEQDVEGFDRYLSEHAGPRPDAQDALAAAMVGRRRDGTPLATQSSGSIPGVEPDDPLNHFRFDGDPNGTQCPFGAHIRRANPRNGDMPSPKVSGLTRLLALVGIGPKTLRSDAKASARFHRILRRGREYAPPATVAGSPQGAGPSGIHFLCLVANLARQFEFLQSAWIMSTKFDAMTGESDPLLGSREAVPGTGASDNFSVPTADGVCRRWNGLPRFVSVRGGAYFFLPSLAAIRYLAAERDRA